MAESITVVGGIPSTGKHHPRSRIIDTPVRFNRCDGFRRWPAQELSARIRFWWIHRWPCDRRRTWPGAIRAIRTWDDCAQPQVVHDDRWRWQHHQHRRQQLDGPCADTGSCDARHSLAAAPHISASTIRTQVETGPPANSGVKSELMQRETPKETRAPRVSLLKIWEATGAKNATHEPWSIVALMIVSMLLFVGLHLVISGHVATVIAEPKTHCRQIQTVPAVIKATWS